MVPRFMNTFVHKNSVHEQQHLQTFTSVHKLLQCDEQDPASMITSNLGYLPSTASGSVPVQFSSVQFSCI